jgi:hypothetical protein
MHRIFSGEACLGGPAVVRNRVSKCLGGGHDGARALLNTMHDENIVTSLGFPARFGLKNAWSVPTGP